MIGVLVSHMRFITTLYGYAVTHAVCHYICWILTILPLRVLLVFSSCHELFVMLLYNNKAMLLREQMVVDQFKEVGVDISRKLWLMASDGASVMTGKNNGTAKRLQGHNPFMINIHCVAHRVPLATQAILDDGDVSFMEDVLTSVYSWFSRSPARYEKLYFWQETVQSDQLKVLTPNFKVRWLYMVTAMLNFVRSHEAIAEAVWQEFEEKRDATAKAIFENVTSLRFIIMLHGMTDMLKVITELSGQFQKESLRITAVPGLVNEAISQLLYNWTTQPLASVHLNAVYRDIHHSAESGVYWKGHKVASSTAQYEELKKQYEKVLCQAANLIITGLQERFPETELMSAFKLLDPANWPVYGNTAEHVQALRDYGIKEGTESRKWFKALCNHYGKSKQTDDGTEHAPMIDADALEEEWFAFKPKVWACMCMLPTV